MQGPGPLSAALSVLTVHERVCRVFGTWLVSLAIQVGDSSGILL